MFWGGRAKILKTEWSSRPKMSIKMPRGWLLGRGFPIHKALKLCTSQEKRFHPKVACFDRVIGATVCENLSQWSKLMAELAVAGSRSPSLYAIARPSVVCLSVTFMRPTQAFQFFDNISTALGILAIHWHPLKILWRSSKGNPSAGGVKHKRGSKI